MLYVGNNAVVCRCWVAGVEYAIKCYPRKHRNARAIYGDTLYEGELAIQNFIGAVEWVDVVVRPWVEGRTLDKFFRDPTTDYCELLENFERLAIDTLRGERAHGDIKPENIVVTPSGDMRFIDFDATWVPGFELGDIEELGTPSFSYPGRAVTHFDKSIDDFPIALITTMLAAMSYRREMFEESIDADNSLFYTRAVVSGSDMMLNKALSIFERKSDKRHYAIAIALYNCPGPIPSLLSLLEGRL